MIEKTQETATAAAHGHAHSARKGWLKRAAEAVFQIESSVARAWAAGAHRRLFASQWRMNPTPEWFDHTIDLMYLWPKTNNSLWLERGVYGSLALKGGTLLELACGDGFNSKHFYAHRSKSVIACDFDPEALQTAKRKNSAPNIDYRLADIRTQMPEGRFDNVVWDAAIEHFTPSEIDSIMKGIKARLADGGVLSGYTLVELESGEKHLHQHEHEFKDMAELKAFLTPHFKNVRVFETIYPTRHNLYFWASDAVIPFDANWPHCV